MKFPSLPHSLIMDQSYQPQQAGPRYEAEMLQAYLIFLYLSAGRLLPTKVSTCLCESAYASLSSLTGDWGSY